jgi:hypothetical protein
MCSQFCSGRRLRLSAVFSCLAIVASVQALPAAELTLDFEPYTDLTSLTTQIPGLTFTHATVVTTTGTLFEGEFPPYSGVAALLDVGGPLSLSINLPAFGAIAVNGFRGYFTYTEPVTVEAFGAGGVSLGTVSSTYSTNFVTSGNSPNELLELIAPDIRSLTITGSLTGESFVLDDLALTFEPSQTAIPEPQSWMLMACGIAVLARLRRQAGR